ncbi:MAG TPA: alkaline phosphatase family protein, partial [Lacipirellula sp.]
MHLLLFRRWTMLMAVSSAIFPRLLPIVAIGICASTASLASAREKKVLTIAIDGLRPDALVAANTPHIDSLVDGTFFDTAGPSGIFADYAQAEHLTFSGPGWGAYMTGLHVDRHGADTNGFENVVPGTTDWFTPLEAFDPTLNTHRVLTWQIASDSFPSGADTAENFEYSSNGDQRMTNRVVQLMQNPATDVLMTFFSDVDGAGHTFGFSPAVPQYLAEIANTDAQIGQIISAMKSRPTFADEDWLVILTSDHGGLGTGHSGGLPPQRTIPFVVAGPLATTVLPQAHPRQVDVAATVLTYFGAPIPANYDGHAIGLAPAGPVPATFGQNLVFNGDAEYGRGFSGNGAQQYAAGWDDPGPGGITQINYLAGNGFPSPSDPGPEDRGSSFFSGGLNAISTMTQRIDVSNLASAISGGEVSFVLSAWLGGYLNQNDRATVVARLLDGAGAEIGSAELAPVTAAERGNATKLLFREQLAALPSETRFVDLELT